MLRQGVVDAHLIPLTDRDVVGCVGFDDDRQTLVRYVCKAQPEVVGCTMEVVSELNVPSVLRTGSSDLSAVRRAERLQVSDDEPVLLGVVEQVSLALTGSG